ncbi:MAG: hypothetical protein IJ512_06665 [Ruminococcus sp.]|nr:hypothetical protein [Ruminococcus sp.]
MVDGLVIAGILILCVMAVTELVYIFFQPDRKEKQTERSAFTVLVYRKEDADFAVYLQSFLSRACWMDRAFLSEIYVVHLNVPEEQSEAVRRICEKEASLIYCSLDAFTALLFPEKNSAEKDCNLSEKIV